MEKVRESVDVPIKLFDDLHAHASGELLYYGSTLPLNVKIGARRWRDSKRRPRKKATWKRDNRCVRSALP